MRIAGQEGPDYVRRTRLRTMGRGVLFLQYGEGAKGLLGMAVHRMILGRD